LPSEAEIVEAVRARGLQLGDDAPARLRKAAEDEGQLGRQDSLHLIALDGALDDEPEGGGTLRVDVPAFAYDIHDLERLVQIADVLAPAP
jgi:hypothetical protein